MQARYTYSMQKTAQKNTLFEKWHHFEYWQKWLPCKGYSLCKIITLGQRNKNTKTISKTNLQAHFTFSMQKIARKNSKYSRNETILNIGKNDLILGQKIKLPKTYQKRIYKHIRPILRKKKPKKSIIREMRPIWILANMTSMQRL